MHAVLDGEASDAEARELEMQLAADPAAQAEFADWKRLFEALDAVPKEHAPEGLVASIVSAMPQAPGAPAAQPFPGRRVLGHTAFGISRQVPTRSVTMTEQSSRRIFAHRKAWLGGGIAAAAAVVVAQIAFDFPLPKDVVGTVIPAQRYRAAQNGSEQVQLGAPAGQSAPTGTVPEASRALAEKSAAESALKADMTAQKTADLTAQKTADLTAQKTADLTAQKTADRTAQMTSDRTAQMTSDRTAQMTSDRTAQMTSDRTAQMTSDRTAQKTADLTAQKTADLTAQKTADRATQTELKAERTPQQ
jgi:hypothetical protein